MLPVTFNPVKTWICQSPVPMMITGQLTDNPPIRLCDGLIHSGKPMQTIVAHAALDIRLEKRDIRKPAEDELLVAIERGGICGSDLHYFQHGGIGTIRLREPMILGHEVAGRIVEKGSDKNDFDIGQRVAVSPSRPCLQCRFCLEGKPNHCENMRFYGSAMPFPHIQGAFRELLTVNVSQCAVADELSAEEAAMAEPLAVCIHAARQSGNLVGKRVLITGCGPIGLLCLLVARSAGAAEIIVTDIAEFPLQVAHQLGADATVRAGVDAQSPLSGWYASKGYFDVLFECSGVAAALNDAIPALRPKGTIVQLGLGGDMTVDVQQITAKELQLRGSFRFHEEFHTGVNWMQRKLIDVSPLLTHTFGMDSAEEAFTLASDRTQAIKVQLQFAKT